MQDNTTVDDADTRRAQTNATGTTDIEPMYEVDDTRTTNAGQTHEAETVDTTRTDSMDEVGVGPETTGEGQTHVPIVEEEMRAGKHQVNTGGVPVRSDTIEEHPETVRSTVHQAQVEKDR